MKRFCRFVAGVVVAVALILAVGPCRAMACGGFVAVRGEHVFHSVYCDSLDWEQYRLFRWYDTEQRALNAGLTMCPECATGYYDDFDEEYCDFAWVGSDHLLVTLVEHAYETGYMDGEAHAEEEYSYYYNDGYDSGYSDGWAAGEDAGEDAGYRQAEADEQRKEEEYRTNRAGALFSISICVGIGILCGILSKRKNKR